MNCPRCGNILNNCICEKCGFDLKNDEVRVFESVCELFVGAAEEFISAIDKKEPAADQEPPDNTVFVEPISVSEKEITATDRFAADVVIAKIDAIGTVEYSDACKRRIKDADLAYRKLTAAQKELVTNYSTLMEARTAFIKATADQAAVYAVKARIDAIGTVEYTDACLSRIHGAELAYLNLTATQKELVTNYSVLTNARAAFDKAKADQDAADTVIAKIDEIGTVEYSDACLSRINAAESAYNSLSSAQKKLVTNHPVLVAATSEYTSFVSRGTGTQGVKPRSTVSMGSVSPGSIKRYGWVAAAVVALLFFIMVIQSCSSDQVSSSQSPLVQESVDASSQTSQVTADSVENESNSYILLSQLDCISQSNDYGAFAFYDETIDNYGTTYKDGIGGTDGSGLSWKEYSLDGTYSEMRGRVVLNYDCRTKTNDDVYLWIYGDNIVLFMSQEIKAGCEPQDFTVDLTGIKTLKVVIQGKSMLRLVDCGLYKDANTPSVSTASRAAALSQSRIYLTDLDWFNASSENGGFYYYNSVKDNFGTVYGNGLGGTSGYETFQEYRLDGTYSEMRGRVVLNYDCRTQTNDDIYLWLYGDDELIFQSQEIKAGCEPQDFTVDLTGVKTLKVVIQGKNMLRLVDCGLYKDANTPTISTASQAAASSQSRIYLTDLDWFNASSENGGFYYYNSVKDNFGTVYGNGLSGRSSYESFQEYRLDGAYSEMQGRVVLNYDCRTQTNDDIYLWLYGDDELIFQSQEIKAGCEPQDFTVDLTGVKTLKVVIQGKNMLRLVDCILYK